MLLPTTVVSSTPPPLFEVSYLSPWTIGVLPHKRASVVIMFIKKKKSGRTSPAIAHKFDLRHSAHARDIGDFSHSAPVSCDAAVSEKMYA